MVTCANNFSDHEIIMETVYIKIAIKDCIVHLL